MIDTSEYKNKIVDERQMQFVINSFKENNMAHFSNSKEKVNEIQPNIGNYYFLNKEDGLNSIRIWDKYVSQFGSCEEKNEIWITIPLVFPVATLHSINSSYEHFFNESVGGSLCFSPDEVNVSRLFSSIQGLSDVGATFFQIVIAKIEGVTSSDAIIVREEFNKVFNENSIVNRNMISVKPIGWRRRTESRNNSTIPIKKKNKLEHCDTKNFDVFYNAILTLETQSENSKEILLKLANLFDVFLNKIKLILPSLDIVKVTELYRDDFFEVTVRIQTMPSYVSTEGEDFGIKENGYFPAYNSKEMKNPISSIYFGDIRLINPNNLVVDNRIPCGLFKTFSLISENTLFKLSGCMATYIPLAYNRKKRIPQTTQSSKIDICIPSEIKKTVSQFFDQIQSKYNTPKLFNSINNSKENSIKTPPPTNFLSNNSTKCISTNSNCDFRYNSINNWYKKSCTCTPTTKASLNKVSYTPFSSSATEIDSSPWLNNDSIISSDSIFTCEQENQHLIPPRISSLNCMNSYYKSENDVQIFNTNITSNLLNEDVEYKFEKSFEEDSLIINDRNIVNFLNYDHVENSLFKEKKPCKLQSINLNFNRTQNRTSKENSAQVDLLESYHIHSENKEFDIMRMLENIFSEGSSVNAYTDNQSTKNLYNFQNALNEEVDENKNDNNMDRKTDIKLSQPISKNLNAKFDFWGLELFNSIPLVSSETSFNGSVQMERVSEFLPNEFVEKKCALF